MKLYTKQQKLATLLEVAIIVVALGVAGLRSFVGLSLLSQAVVHGSASREIGQMYANGGCGLPQDWTQSIGWYQRAIDQGDSEATICLGEQYEYGGRNGTKADLKKAMQLYEQATGARNEVTVNSAIWHILDLWVEKHVIPSAKFALSTTDPTVFLSKFDPDINAKKYSGIYRSCVYPSDNYALHRLDLFAKIRHALGLFSRAQKS